MLKKATYAPGSIEQKMHAIIHSAEPPQSPSSRLLHILIGPQ
jgi:hypothetical protein